jgi:hypothetical protein
MSSKPLSDSEKKRKLEQFNKHQKGVSVYDLSSMSDLRLRELKNNGRSWVIETEEDKRWA